MKRIVIISILLFAVLMCLVSCNQDEATTTLETLEINIGTDGARGIEAQTMETQSYNVTVRNASGEVVFSSMSSSKTRYTALVPVGICHIYVEALNSMGDVIGSGSVSGEVVSGAVNTITVYIDELIGNGTFSISISCAEGHSLSYSIMDAVFEEVAVGSLSYTNGRYSASVQLPNGFYAFSIVCDDTGECIKADTLRVVKDKTIVYEAEYLFLADGTLSIVNEILVTPEIVLHKSAKSLPSNRILTVSADIPNDTDYLCYWVVDERPLGSPETYVDLELSMADFREGEHTVELIVTNGSVIWSESTKFNVLPERATELEVSGDVEIWILGDVLIPYDLVTRVTNGRSTWNFSRMGHRLISMGNETRILSCSLNRSDYTYYLRSEDDKTNGRTIVYVIIDQDIEDPAYLEVSFEKETQFTDRGAFGIWLTAQNTVFSPELGNNNQRMRGLVAFTNNNGSRIIKVPADRYSFNGSSSSNLGNNWFYVVSDVNPVTLSSGETKHISFTEGEYAIVSIQFSEYYEDGTEFYEYSYYGDCQITDGCITFKQRPNQDYSYILYPKYEKDCYYTLISRESAGQHFVDAVKHDSVFFDTGVSLQSGEFHIEVTADCMVPENLFFQCRIGDSYSDPIAFYEYAYGNNTMSIPSSGPLEIWTTNPDEYDFLVSMTTASDGKPLVKISIIAAYENYALLNLNYDFDFNLTSDLRSVADFDTDTGWCDIFIVNKEISQIKTLPGTYNWSGGSWQPSIIQTDEGKIHAVFSLSSFTVYAGNTVDLTITMESVED